MMYEYEVHNPVKIKGLPWLICNKCGLLYLRNRFTDWSIKKGCNSEDHPEYLSERRNTGGI